MTGCQIIEFNARYSDGKPIGGLIDTPIDSLRTHVVAEAAKNKIILMNWFERQQIAQSVIIYTLNK